MSYQELQAICESLDVEITDVNEDYFVMEASEAIDAYLPIDMLFN